MPDSKHTHVVFTGRFEDKTKRGLAAAKANVTAYSQEMAGKMSAATKSTNNLGKALAAANEKTERVRQVVTQFGGAVGGAAGQVVYWAGSLGYLVGKISLVEGGIMLVIGAIGGLVYSLTTETEAEKEAREEAERHLDVMRDLSDELERQTMLASGMASSRVDFELAYKSWEDLAVLEKGAYDDMVAIRNKAEREHWDAVKGGMERVEAAEAHYWTIKRARQEQEIRATIAQVKVDALAEAQAKKTAAAKAGGGSGGKGKQVQQEESLWARMVEVAKAGGAQLLDEAIQIAQEKEQAWADHQRRLVGIEWQAYRQMWAMQDENAKRKQRVQANLDKFDDMMVQQALEREKQQTEARAQAINQSIQLTERGLQVGMQIATMYDAFGERSAKTEEQRAKAYGMRLMFENMIAAATETAKAYAAFAEKDYFAFGMHLFAAGLHSVAAAQAAANPSAAAAAAGGGGRAGGGASSNFRDEQDSGLQGSGMDESAGQRVVIYVYGDQVIGGDANRVFAEGAETYYSEQNPGRDQRRF